MRFFLLSCSARVKRRSKGQKQIPKKHFSLLTKETSCNHRSKFHFIFRVQKSSGRGRERRAERRRSFLFSMRAQGVVFHWNFSFFLQKI